MWYRSLVACQPRVVWPPELNESFSDRQYVFMNESMSPRFQALDWSVKAALIVFCGESVVLVSAELSGVNTTHNMMAAIVFIWVDR